MQCVADCCSVLQCVTVCCSVLQYVEESRQACNLLEHPHTLFVRTYIREYSVIFTYICLCYIHVYMSLLYSRIYVHLLEHPRPLSVRTYIREYNRDRSNSPINRPTLTYLILQFEGVTTMAWSAILRYVLTHSFACVP